MPFDRFNIADLRVLTIWDQAVAPGVLTHAEVICELNSIQYGACVCHLYLCIPDSVVQYSWIALASGVLSMMTPVAWQGEISIPEGSFLAAQLRGHQNGNFRVSWSRQTITNIKETGDVARAINK